jgi:pimeloyl-ACP methyl ester carboxylesterase
VEQLVRRLPEDTDLELDIICHSRGGLVSRVLAEQQRALSLGARTMKVNKIVFVATPNAGTILADGKHLGDLVDQYTNLFTVFPTGGAVEAIAAVITVVKQIAIGALNGLDGIHCMAPKGRFLRGLNKGPQGDTAYYAFAANYEPIDRSLTAQARDFLMDRIFGIENDLIVPTAGVYDENGSGWFPISRKHVFGPHSGVQHSNFFTSPQFDRRLQSWLAVP